MSETRQFFPPLGLLATFGMSAYMVVQLAAQSRPEPRHAATAEVRDARGQLVLRGNFDAGLERVDDTQRTARLTATGVDDDAEGIAEIESSKNDSAAWALEFELQQLEPGAVFTLAIDGDDIGRARADRQGRLEFEVTLPGLARRTGP